MKSGGGSGEHFAFVRHEFDSYFVTDLTQRELHQGAKYDSRVEFKVENVENLSFPNKFFDRVIATCLLHHVNKPEEALKEILRVLKPGGVVSIFLSCDPGILVRVLRSLTSSRKAKKLGFRGYKLMIAREHRNHISSLLELAKFVFRDAEIELRYRPFLVPSWNLNGYLIFEASLPSRNRETPQ